MHPASKHKLIITGTGRAGTTFLVRLLTELGLDTGFDRTSWRASYDEHCRAGLERDWAQEDGPYVLKNPEFCRTLPVLLAEGGAPAIDHVLIPIRDLQTAARSRIRIGGKDGEIPGGLWLTSDPGRQAPALAEALHELMHALAVHDVPFTLLPFPRFAMDPEFTYSKLRFLIGGVSPVGFREAFARVAEPGLIHAYAGDGLSTDAAIAAAYRARRREAEEKSRQRRRHRRMRLLAAVLAVVGVGGVFLLGGR